MRALLGVVVLAACSGGAATERPVAPTVVPVAPDAGAVDAAPAIDAAPVPERAARIELTFVGDVMFGGTFSGRFVPQDAETHDPLAEVETLLASDLAMANLETTVVAEIPAVLEGNLRFAATPGQVATLPRHGIRAVTLANNHANDLDATGVAETPGHLAALGIATIGAARAEAPRVRAETVEVNGWRIAFVAATTKLNRAQAAGDPPVPFVDKADLARELVPVIAEVRPAHDLVIVVLHWGVQYDDAPSPWQVEAAHAFVDAGADAVIGHHPHVLQAIERRGDAVIAYSLGNFVFQNATKVPRLTGVLRLGFAREGACLDRVVFHPAVIDARPVHHPRPAAGEELAQVVERVQRLSETEWVVEGERLVAKPACAEVAAP